MSLLQMSFSGAVLIFVTLAVRAVAINKLPKNTFLFLWGVTLVRLLIPFSIPSPASVYSHVDLYENAEILMENMFLVMPEVQMGLMNKAEQTKSMGEAGQERVQQIAGQIPSVSVWQVCWCIGAALCVVFFAMVYLRWFLRFRKARSVQNRVVGQWLQEHRLKRPISIRQSDRIDTPLTYGIFRPVILMPEDTDWKDIERLQYILQHEYVHICRFDTVTKMICALAVSVHWFNPFVWVMYLLLNRDLELSCDERVVRRFGIGSRKTYANVLISMEAKRSGLMPFYNNFSKNAIEERITSIMKIKKTSIFATFIAVVLIACITAACATSAAKQEDGKNLPDTENDLSQEVQTNTPDSDTDNKEPVAASQKDELSAVLWDGKGNVEPIYIKTFLELILPSLSAEDAAVIVGLIASDSWTEGTSDCLNDCIWFLGNKELLYHSDCGTLNDTKNQRSLHLTEDQQAELNAIIEKSIKVEHESSWSITVAPKIKVITVVPKVKVITEEYIKIEQ